MNAQATTLAALALTIARLELENQQLHAQLAQNPPPEQPPAPVASEPDG